MPQTLFVNALCPTIPRAMVEASRKDLTPDIDAHDALAAVGRYFQNADRSYRPLIIRQQGDQDFSVTFAVPERSSDDTAGKIIRNAIAAALENVLNAEAYSPGQSPSARRSEGTAQYAHKIAMLIADGSLKQACVKAVQESLPDLDGNPEVDVRVLTGRRDLRSSAPDCVTLCHTLTWKHPPTSGDPAGIKLQADIINSMSLDRHGTPVTSQHARVHVPESHRQASVLAANLHCVSQLFRSRDIEVMRSTLDIEAWLDQLKGFAEPGQPGTGTQSANGKNPKHAWELLECPAKLSLIASGEGAVLSGSKLAYQDAMRRNDIEAINGSVALRR